MLAWLATPSPWILNTRSCAIRVVTDSLSTPGDGCYCVWCGHGPADLRAIADTNDAEQALSIGAEHVGKYSQGFTNEEAP
jgi:hypothetical protein